MKNSFSEVKLFQVKPEGLILKRFDEITEFAYIDYISEWEQDYGDIVPSASKRNNMSFDDLLKKWAFEESEGISVCGLIPSTLFFMVDDNDRILGAIHFRHKLNERLLQNGGNIGYGIRSSERRKGYASLMLGMLLDKIQAQGYEKVLITCDEDNAWSARTIEKNKGILYDQVPFDGVMTRRYWIYLDKPCL